MGAIKVAVIAYCGNNFGDDLFMTLLVRRYPYAEFHFFAAGVDGMSAIADEPNVRAINDAEFAKCACEYSALVVLGGSMFQQGPGWARQCARYAIRFARARSAGAPVCVMGASFGPVRTRGFTVAYKAVFRMVSWVSVRDELSYARLQGIRGLHCLPDIALCHPLLREKRVQDGDVNRMNVGISVMDFGGGVRHEGYLESMASLVEDFARDGRVTLFSFQDTLGVSDSRKIDRVLDMVPEGVRGSIEVIHYDPVALNSATRRIAECDLFVASRFHSAIAAIALRVPVVAVGYHEKVKSGLYRFSQSVPVLDPTELRNDRLTAATLRRRAWSATGEELASLRTESERHFERLDDLLAAASLTRGGTVE